MLLRLEDIILPNDLFRLPSITLKEICTDLDLSSSGTALDLAMRIWDTISQNQQKEEKAREKYKEKIFCGKTSVTWYHLTGNSELKGLKQFIIEGSLFNPFQELRVPDIEDLTSDPVIIGACDGDNDGEYFLRFMYKSGVIKQAYGTEINTFSRSDVTTVFVDEMLD